MIPEYAVTFQHLSKAYVLFDRPQDRLKESLFKYIGKHYGRQFWALRDVSHQVRRGEVLGVIGRNGSGKSTLLQLIAGTLQPTSGSLEVHGRLSAILELGAGFNPEFSGRENIFLNGAILGLSRQEIETRLDEIIAFAGIGAFIDQPVKIYSSGMYIRLAFAIAANIDPDILLIDEAFAVGDAAFTLKCINRMKQLKERGATILLVTHDVQTVRSFCDTALWLHEGSAQMSGSPIDVTSQYLQYLFGENQPLQGEPLPSLVGQLSRPRTQPKIDLDSRSDLVRWGSGEAKVVSCGMYNGLYQSQSVFEHGEKLHIEVEFHVEVDIRSESLGVGIALRNIKGLDVITATTLDAGVHLPPLHAGQTLKASFDLENILGPGEYALVLNMEDRQGGTARYLDFIENSLIFQVVARQHIFSLVLPPVQQTVQIDDRVVWKEA
jgi:lipopolysaccharide transport system ATP-binding protein